jgi:uncharacterized membrane protein YhaH (DUF805 family)
MMKAIGDALAFRGRLTRLGYWRWQMALVVLSAGFAYGAVAVAMGGGPRWLSALVFAPMLIAVVAGVGVVARRLHDRGRGVRWLIAFLVGPWGLAALSIWLPQHAPVADQAWTTPAVLATALLSLVLNVWGFVEIGVLRGQPGPNRFGPPPPK